jgi:hypothetical protein
MCLWFVTFCPGCGVFTPMPNTPPQYCNNSECFRKTLNPNFLTEEEKEDYLDDDYPCTNDCSRQHCGLVVRYWCDANCSSDNCGEIMHYDYCNSSENVNCQKNQN